VRKWERHLEREAAKKLAKAPLNLRRREESAAE
jgi:hypothetical protein